LQHAYDVTVLYEVITVHRITYFLLIHKTSSDWNLV